MLALRNGRVVDVDGLVDGLWGEELPAAPRNALHHHIARLRAALGEGRSSARPTGTPSRTRASTLCGSRSCSRRRARRCATATSPPRLTRSRRRLALWRGPALQGLDRRGGSAPRHAGSRRCTSTRLEEDFEIRLALGASRAHAGAPFGARGQPLPRAALGQLMLALYRSGRQADALETFQEARRVLADELGLEPGPELRRLQEAILAHDPAIATVPVDRRRRGNLPRAFDVVRRTRGRARPGLGRSARAPPRDAHRRARRRQEPARRRGRAFPRGRVPGRHLARRLRAGGWRGRRRPPPRTRRRRSRLRSVNARLHGFATCSGSPDPRRVRARARRAARIASTVSAECPQA